MTEMTHRIEVREAEHSGRCPMRRLTNIALGFALPALVLAGAIWVAKYLIATGPEAERKRPPRRARLVEIAPVQLGTFPTCIHASGLVRPAREIELRARVNGEVVWVDEKFVPGGLFAAGAPMLRLDDSDYRLALDQRMTELWRVEAKLQQELGSQSVARREFELLGEEMPEANRDLVLRKPQLAAVQAEREAAGTAIDQACLDLARTEIRAPFNAVISTRGVELGAQVGATTQLAKLVGTDAYWIEVTVPVSELRWLSIPRGPDERGSKARIFDAAAWGEGVHREGAVFRLMNELEEQGQMARLLISVEDPLGLEGGEGQPPILLLNTYLEDIELEGAPLENAVAIDRRHLHDGDRVWLMSPENKLEIRALQVAFRGADRVLVQGQLSAGERLVVSDLPSPVEGMLLRTAKAATAEAADAN